MVNPLKTTAVNVNINKLVARQKVEPPILTFNRMCYGYVNNDWLAVCSAGCRLVVTIVLMIFVLPKSISV